MALAERIEPVIFRNLLHNENYYRKVIPFVKPDYFTDANERAIYEEVWNFASTYNKHVTADILSLNIQDRRDLEAKGCKIEQINEILENANQPEDLKQEEWLLDTTEKWCQEQAIHNALIESIQIADGRNSKVSKTAIPSILQEALAVSFDTHIGHDYLNDAQERYEYYHRPEEKVPFDLDKLNLITDGGLSNKTLSVILAGTGVGKSLVMCHMASAAMVSGKNVVYITCEMSEEQIAKRIDANLMDTNIKQVKDIPESIFTRRVQKIAETTQGNLVIKEYPTADGHVGHFRSFLKELSLKREFKPDIIFIDYLNICASSRYKGNIVNSYQYIKSIAEEIRGLAVEQDVPIVSATQVTRTGYGSTKLELTDTSESFGLPATADFMFGLISTEECEQNGRLIVQQLKNRYNPVTFHKSFEVGIDRSKMKLYNVESDMGYQAQEEGELFDSLQKTFEEQENNVSKFSQFII